MTTCLAALDRSAPLELLPPAGPDAARVVRATVELRYAATRTGHYVRALRAGDLAEMRYQRECMAEHMEDAEHHAGAQPLLTRARQHLAAGRINEFADLLRAYRVENDASS